MSEIIPDEIQDEYARLARRLWASLRETDFHDGRNRIAALLRTALASSEEFSLQHASDEVRLREERDRLRAENAALKKSLEEERGRKEALLEIRDKWLPALRRDANEGDKTLCHAGGIEFLLARTVPLHAYPITPRPPETKEPFQRASIAVRQVEVSGGFIPNTHDTKEPKP